METVGRKIEISEDYIGNQFQVNTTNKSKMKPINQYLVFLCC